MVTGHRCGVQRLGLGEFGFPRQDTLIIKDVKLCFFFNIKQILFNGHFSVSGFMKVLN
jgi:hypothetical protein